MRALVNHHGAIERFLDLEAAGDEGKSLRPLTDHLRKPACDHARGARVCGEQVSLDLHTVDAGTTEEIWAPPGEEAVIVLLEGDVEWAGAHASVGRCSRTAPRPSTSRRAPPFRSPLGRRRSSRSSRRSMRASPSRVTSRPSSGRPRSSSTTAANRGGNARCTTSSRYGAGRAPARRRDVHARRAVVVVPAPQARRPRRRTRARRGVLLPLRPA